MSGAVVDRVRYALVKKQFSLLHLLLTGGAALGVVRLLQGSCDAKYCARLLDDDLQALCALRARPEAHGGFLQPDAASAAPSAAHPASSASAGPGAEPPVELPARCATGGERRRAGPEFKEELLLRPMTGLGHMRLVPGTNSWGIPMANSTLTINGKTLTFDDILYGYDLMFENLALFSYTSWFGVSTQQDPSDAFQLASLIWQEQPDLLVEIGTNTGGGAIFYATVMREYNPDSLVLTIDPKDPAQDWASAVGKGCPSCTDVRCTRLWNSKNVHFIQGRASDPKVLAEMERLAPRFSKVMVMHDGSHAYADVLEDLNSYDRFTTVGSYMVVQDTKMTRMYMPVNGNPYPLGAAREFMNNQGKDRYVVDKQYEFLLYSQHHNGWLRKLRT